MNQEFYMGFANIPVIEQTNLKDIIMEDSLEDHRRRYYTTYKFNDVFPVPRVTEILKHALVNPFIEEWRIKVGKEEAERVSKVAKEIGLAVHNLIEYYLINRKPIPDYMFKIKLEYESEVKTCFANFLRWEKSLNNNGYFIEQIIAIEVPVITPYFGGTIDCIAKINGKIYIIDFKTSKSISQDYLYQLSAYYWGANNGYIIGHPDLHIDGIGVVRISKTGNSFEDVFFNEHIPYQREIINKYVCGFASILTVFYNNIYLPKLYRSYKKEYNRNEVLGAK